MVQYEKAKYYHYEEITKLIHQWQDEYPSLLKVGKIGTSYEGRNIWYTEITQQNKGAAGNKPAFYIDANLHAGEVTGSAVALYTIHHLLSEYGKDEFVTHLLDTRTFYIIPRISVDGSEVYLNTPYVPRSSTKVRPYFDEEEGILAEDLTGNGVITTMRIKSESGSWKKSEKDPRIMLRRDPADYKGEFYHLFTEGLVKDFNEEDPLLSGKTKYYLDVNRNFPADWQPTEVAGNYPLSEPESRAIAEFIFEKKNITGIISYHTAGGIILRPSAVKKDQDMNQDDLNVLKALAKRGEELTGYPSTGVFEGFNYQIPPKPLPGSFLEWSYENLGLYNYTTELWDMAKSAGIEKPLNQFGRYWLDVSEEDHLKILAWNDNELDGAGFKEWETFDHPQLGKVEIGGWDLKYTRQNPPLKFLEKELHGNMLFSLEHAAASPLLQVTDTKVEQLTDDLYRISAKIENTGYLPTYLSEKAKEREQVRDIQVTIEGDGIALVEGKAEQKIGHLDGYGKKPDQSFLILPNILSSKTVSWVIRANGADKVSVNVSSCKAGKVREEVELSTS